MVAIERYQKGWKSSIHYNGGLMSLGINEQEAAVKAYDMAAHGLIKCEESELDSPLSEVEKQELDTPRREGLQQRLLLAQQKARDSAETGVGLSSVIHVKSEAADMLWLGNGEIPADAKGRQDKKRKRGADEVEAPADEEGLQALSHRTDSQIASGHTESKQAQQEKEPETERDEVYSWGRRGKRGRLGLVPHNIDEFVICIEEFATCSDEFANKKVGLRWDEFCGAHGGGPFVL